MAGGEDWRGDLERWLEPFLTGLSHPARRRMYPRAWSAAGGGFVAPPDRLSGRRRPDLPGRKGRKAAQIPRPRSAPWDCSVLVLVDRLTYLKDPETGRRRSRPNRPRRSSRSRSRNCASLSLMTDSGTAFVDGKRSLTGPLGCLHVSVEAGEAVRANRHGQGPDRRRTGPRRHRPARRNDHRPLRLR